MKRETTSRNKTLESLNLTDGQVEEYLWYCKSETIMRLSAAANQSLKELDRIEKVQIRAELSSLKTSMEPRQPVQMLPMQKMDPISFTIAFMYGKSALQSQCEQERLELEIACEIDALTLESEEQQLPLRNNLARQKNFRYGRNKKANYSSNARLRIKICN